MSGRDLFATVVLIAAGCLGCATARPFDSVALKATRPASLVLIVRPPSPFKVGNASAMPGQGGLLGYLLFPRLRELPDGKIVRKSAKLADPAIQIGEDLRDELADRLGVRASTVILPVAESTPESSSWPGAQQTAEQTADLVLVIRTEKWSLFPDELLLGNDSPLSYTSQVWFELVDRRGERRQLASGDCQTGNDGRPSPWRYDDLLGANAIRLHEQIERASEQCTDQFMRILLGALPETQGAAKSDGPSVPPPSRPRSDP